MNETLYFIDLDTDDLNGIEVRDIKMIEAQDGIIHIINMDDLVFRCIKVW